MMVAHAAGEGPPLDALPQLAAVRAFGDVAGDYPALGAEEGLMGGGGYQVSPLVQRSLEVGPQQTEDMGGVIHQQRPGPHLRDYLRHLPHRLRVQHHALAQDDELGMVLGDELRRPGDIYPVGVIRPQGEVNHRPVLGLGADGDAVPQRSHRLGAQVPAPADMVVHHAFEPLRLHLPVHPVEEVHQPAEHDGVCHLPADGPYLHLGAAQELAHLLRHRLLHLADEPRPLVVIDLSIPQPLELSVLGVSPRRVGYAEQLHQWGCGLLRGNQVDGVLLPPDGVVAGFVHQVPAQAVK